MNVGQITHRAEFESIIASPTLDAHGEANLKLDSNWVLHARRLVEVITKGGREFWKVDKVNMDVSYVLRVPYDRVTRKIDSTMRIMLNGRRLEVVAVYNVDERNAMIEIQAKEPK